MSFFYEYEAAVKIDDLTVVNFQTGRKGRGVIDFGNANASQDWEYLPAIDRFIAVSNGNTCKMLKVVDGKPVFEKDFQWQDDRSSAISGSANDVFPKTSFIRASGCTRIREYDMDYVIVIESGSELTPKYKEKIAYKARVDYDAGLLRIESAMRIVAGAAGWPGAAGGEWNKTQEISGAAFVDGYLYTCAFQYSATDTPYTHIFKVDDVFTNPGTLTPTHYSGATESASRTEFVKNQGLAQVGGRWFLTRNPAGSGIYEVDIQEDDAGLITDVVTVGKISGERLNDEAGISDFRGDIAYFYNCNATTTPAHIVRIMARVRSEKVQLPLIDFPGCKADYSDLRVYRGTTEVPSVINMENRSVDFLVDNADQGGTNPFPAYSVKWGNAEATAPECAPSDIDAIQNATVGDNIRAWVDPVHMDHTDEFSVFSLHDYDIVDMGDHSRPSDWKWWTYGYVKQDSNIYGPTTYGTRIGYEKGTLLLPKNKLFGPNFTLVTRVRTTDNDGFGLVFCYQDKYRFYFLHADATLKKIAIVRFNGTGNSGRVMAKARFAWVSNTWYEFKVVKTGSLIEGYVDGVRVLSTTDATFDVGRAGLMCAGSTDTDFGRLIVIAQNWDHKDTFDTNTLENYRIVNVVTHDACPDCKRNQPGWQWMDDGFIRQSATIRGPTTYGLGIGYEKGTILLQKGAVFGPDLTLETRLRSADENGMGLVFCYQDKDHFYLLHADVTEGQIGIVRFNGEGNTGTILAERPFDYANDWCDFSVVKTGSSIEGYVNGVLLLSATDATFASGRAGLMCIGNINTDFERVRITSGDIIHDDTFGTDSLDDYSSIDVSTHDAQSNWSISGGTLKQTSDLYGNGSRKLGLCGTYLIFQDKQFADSRIYDTKFRSTDNDGVGLVWNWLDKNNFYIAYWDGTTNKLSFTKMVNGIVRDISSVVRARTLDTWYTLKVVTDKGTTSIYVDGKSIVSATDFDLDRGRAGVFTTGCPGTEFEHLAVTRPIA